MRLVAGPDSVNQNAKIADVAWNVNSWLKPKIADRFMFSRVRYCNLLQAIQQLGFERGLVLVEPIVQAVPASVEGSKQNPRGCGGRAGDAELMLRPNETVFGVVESVSAKR